MGAIQCGPMVRVVTESGIGVILNKENKLFVGGQRVKLFLAREQRKKHGISGAELHTLLRKFEHPPTEVLDLLLGNPHMIPPSWGRREIAFWDSFQMINGRPYVRLLNLLSPDSPCSLTINISIRALMLYQPAAILKENKD